MSAGTSAGSWTTTATMGRASIPRSWVSPSSFVAQMEKPSFPRITGLFGDYRHQQCRQLYRHHVLHLERHHEPGDGQHDVQVRRRILGAAVSQKNIGNQGQFDFDNSNWTRPQADVSGGTGNGSTLASFLLGLPNGGNFPRNANGFYSQHFYAVYVQNDWRVTPRLTLNMGLRWDYEDAGHRAFRPHDIELRPDRREPDQRLRPGRLYARSSPRTPVTRTCSSWRNGARKRVQGLWERNSSPAWMASSGESINGDFKQFQPRIGFAYRLRPNTVIRGGVGKFVQASFDNGWAERIQPQYHVHCHTGQLLHALRYARQSLPGRHPWPQQALRSGPLTNLGQGVNLYNQDPGRMHSWEYSLHLQQEYKGWLFELGYTHNKTYGIPRAET